MRQGTREFCNQERYIGKKCHECDGWTKGLRNLLCLKKHLEADFGVLPKYNKNTLIQTVAPLTRWDIGSSIIPLEMQAAKLSLCSLLHSSGFLYFALTEWFSILMQELCFDACKPSGECSLILGDQGWPRMRHQGRQQFLLPFRKSFVVKGFKMTGKNPKTTSKPGSGD